MRAQFLTPYTVCNVAIDMVEYNIDGFQISVSNSGKHTIKRQLYSRSFTLREAASLFFFTFNTNGKDSMLHFLA